MASSYPDHKHADHSSRSSSQCISDQDKHVEILVILLMYLLKKDY